MIIHNEFFAQKPGTNDTYALLEGSNIDKIMSAKERATLILEYTTDFNKGDEIHIKTIGNGATFWFFGIVAEPAVLDHENGRVILQCFCTLHELTETNTNGLGIFDYEDRDPATVRRIRNFNGKDDTLIESIFDSYDADENLETASGFPYIWNINSGAFGNVDAIYIASLVPFSQIQINVQDHNYGDNPPGELYIYMKRLQADGGVGWDFIPVDDQTNGLQQSGIVSWGADSEENWIKSTQSGQFLFWARLVFYNELVDSGRVTINSIQVRQRVEVDNPIARMAALSADWSFNGVEPQHPVYHEFVGESVLGGLNLLTRLTGDGFRNGTTADQFGALDKQIDWLQSRSDPAPSTYPQLSNLNPTENNFIVSLDEEDIPLNATRLVIRGAGFGLARLNATFENIGNPMGGNSTEWPSGSGFFYNRETNELVNTAAEAATGKVISKEINLKQISSLASSGNSIEASNQLRRTATAILERASLPNRREWQVRIMNIGEPIRVGEQYQLDYAFPDKVIQENVVVNRVRYDLFNQTADLSLTLDGYEQEYIEEEEAYAIIDNEDGVRYPQPVHVRQIEGLHGFQSEALAENLEIPFEFIRYNWDGIGCVPARIFADQFNPLDSELKNWLDENLITSEDLSTWGYHYPGTGNPEFPKLIWTIDTEGEIISREEQI